MPRALKIVLSLLGVIVALIVVAAIVLPLLIDPNDYKDELTAAVKDATGREMTLSGDIELTVFPWLGVSLGETRLANAQGFGEQPFAEIESAQVRVKLLPLLSKRIEIGTVSLDGMRLRLARNEQGRSNWQDILDKMAADKAPADEPEPPPDEGGFSMPDLTISAIEVNDAAVSWNDATTGDAYRLNELKLSTGRLRLGEAFPLELSFLFDAEKQKVSTKVDLVTEVQPDIATQFYRLNSLTLTVLAKGEAIPDGQQQISLTGQGELDLEAGRMKASDIVLQAAGLNVTANVDGNNLNAEPSFNGRITVKEFNPRSVMQQLAIEPPETSDSSALTSAGLDAQFEASTTAARFKQIFLQVDDSILKGEARVSQFDNPAVGFKLALDQMNVDRYLPPESEDEAEPESAEDAASGEISLDALKDLRLDGRISAEQLTVSKLTIKQAELVVTARDGVLTVEPLAANLYNGNLRMQSRVSAAGKRPSYALKGDLNSLAFGPLLRDLIGSDKLNALASLKVDLSTAGNTVSEMQRALDGTLSFELRDGSFNGFDLANLIAAARSRFLDKKIDVADSGKTPFSRFAASLSVSDGIFSGKGLTLRTPVAEADGGGSYNLVQNQLDYTVDTKILEAADSKLSELKGLTIPIKLSGKLFSPDYSVDVASALKGVASQRLQQEKAELQKKVDEKKQELGGEVQKEIQKGLSDLFGGKSRDKQPEQQSEAQSAEEQGAASGGE